jgi:ABC-type glycerol-3-phosphate transport system permease component
VGSKATLCNHKKLDTKETGDIGISAWCPHFRWWNYKKACGSARHSAGQRKIKILKSIWNSIEITSWAVCGHMSNAFSAPYGTLHAISPDFAQLCFKHHSSFLYLEDSLQMDDNEK